jgi:hypothetical protein
MKYNHLFKAASICALVCSTFIASAFQIADGAPPSHSPAAKYIFYWGKHQCDLLEEKGYSGRLELSVDAFRQTLLNAPKLWDGKQLISRFDFKMGDVLVSTADYPSQLASLTQQLAAKVAPGQTLEISDLPLGSSIKGSITCYFKKPAEESQITYGISPGTRLNMLNYTALEQVTWGREDIYETSNRDFFTVSEFWQTIRQEPALTWQPQQKPLPIRCEIGILSPEKVNFSVVNQLESIPYSDLLLQLEPYRYMIQPGSIVTLQLQSAEQYELLFKKNMTIVADDDPRLRLRSKRDQHKLRIVWGMWAETQENLYMKAVQNAKGEPVLPDPPISKNATFRYSNDILPEWGRYPPEAWIDGEPASGALSFRVKLSDSLFYYINSAHYDTAEVRAFFAHHSLAIKDLVIDSIQLEGYDLPPMTFSIFQVKFNDGLLVRNEFSLLKQFGNNPSTARLSAPAPVEEGSELEFKFELPGKSPIVLSVFQTDGWNNFFQDGTYAAGSHSIKVSKSIFKKKGKHYAFLNTLYGIAQVEFEVP